MTFESKEQLFRRTEAAWHRNDPHHKAVLFDGPHTHIVGGLPCIYEPCSLLPRYARDAALDAEEAGR